MLVSFDNISPRSRVWIYHAERNLAQPEITFIESELVNFVESWVSHASEVNGSFKIFHDRFIVLTSDENITEVSGCSIDKSVHLIQSLGEQLNLNLVDRKIAYFENGEVKALDVESFKEMARNGLIEPQTLIFNNTITSKALFDSNWLIPAENSWLAKYFLLAS